MESLAFSSSNDSITLTALDLGQAKDASSDDMILRVQNLSGSYQAEDVTVTVSGTDAIQLWLSTDGEVFGDTIDVGDIPPGSASGVFWLRRVSVLAASGAFTAQLSAIPASWSEPIDTSTSDNVPLITEDS